MEQPILFVGIDVDDSAYHVALRGSEGSNFEFCCKPTVGALEKKLTKYAEKGFELRCCYEATYLGFSLLRSLRKKGINCEVIAPSLIPSSPGRRVKTDKIDCRKLAEFFQNGQLTVVQAPKEQDETVRGIIRTRNFLSNQLRGTKKHLQFLLRTQSMHFREEMQSKMAHYWTPKHWLWLDGKIAKLQDKALKMNIVWLVEEIRSKLEQIEKYSNEIEKWSHEEKYAEPVKALRCFRGIDTLTAMTIITELGDVRRFNHPSKITSFSGMDIRECSSGGKEKKFGITKMGNRHLRTAVVEAAQFASRSPRVSKDLRKRRELANPKYSAIADRCMNRLSKKANRLKFRGKHTNKIKVACGREMFGFIWEVLHVAA